MPKPRPMPLRPRIDHLEARMMLTAGQPTAPTTAPPMPKKPSVPSIATLKQYYGVDSAAAGASAASQGNGDGAGQTIVILSGSVDASYVGSSSPRWSTSGYALASQAMGLPTNFTFLMLNQKGVDLTAYPSAVPPQALVPAVANEFDLDTQAAHAMAPAARIIDIVMDSYEPADEAEAIRTALKYNPAAISMSYGYTEAQVNDDTAAFLDNNGATYVRSSGDAGGGYQVGYPPSAVSGNATLTDPNAPQYMPLQENNNRTVLVGGTRLGAGQKGQISEVGWGDGANSYQTRIHKLPDGTNGDGSGGGYSLSNPMPAFQTQSIAVLANTASYPTLSQGHRLAPDISMTSLPGFKILAYNSVTGQSNWEIGSGTSLSAPLFAGVMAIVAQRRALAGLAPLSSSDTLNFLYQAPDSDFNDIVLGNNGYPALLGYDLLSGRGAVQAGLIGDLVQATYPTSLTLTSAPSTKADRTTLTASVATVPALKVPVGTVSFYLGRTLLGAVSLGTDGTASIEVDTPALGYDPTAISAVFSSATGATTGLYDTAGASLAGPLGAIPTPAAVANPEVTASVVGRHRGRAGSSPGRRPVAPGQAHPRMVVLGSHPTSRIAPHGRGR